MKNILRNEILKLKNHPRVDKQILSRHLEFLDKEKFFTRPGNPLYHFGIYFLPIHRKSNSIFLVNHEKAAQWIPPGEHLEAGETSIQAVIRGCQEELQFKPKENSIKLFDLSIINIRNLRSRPCRRHYDIWYLVEVNNQIQFNWDHREFHEAKWFTIIDAVNKIKKKNYNIRVSKLLTNY